MEWLNRLNSAIRYIETNLLEEVDIQQAAREAASSSFHFQKMFLCVAGVTVAEYIRRRRLTLAAQELALGGMKVIDAALKYGYESPEAFTKAFSRLHGVTPSKIRRGGIQLVAYPRISFTLSIKGDVGMNYRIIEKGPIKLAYTGRRFRTVNCENLKGIPLFWDECGRNGTCEALCKLTSKPMLGICMNDYDKDMESFVYAVGVEVDHDNTGDFAVLEVPAATWAVFDSVGPLPGAIQDVTARIYSEWFPATGYEHDTLPEFEVYLEGDTKSTSYRCEIWIPVKKLKA